VTAQERSTSAVRRCGHGPTSQTSRWPRRSGSRSESLTTEVSRSGPIQCAEVLRPASEDNAPMRAKGMNLEKIRRIAVRCRTSYVAHRNSRYRIGSRAHEASQADDAPLRSESRQRRSSGASRVQSKELGRSSPHRASAADATFHLRLSEPVLGDDQARSHAHSNQRAIIDLHLFRACPGPHGTSGTWATNRASSPSACSLPARALVRCPSARRVSATPEGVRPTSTGTYQCSLWLAAATVVPCGDWAWIKCASCLMSSAFSFCPNFGILALLPKRCV
jgi:hypothetical protein